MLRRLFIVSNALDDATRSRRGITTDSPAASLKVLSMCRAVRRAGVRPLVLSLGRGRADGTGRWFGATVKRVNGVPVLYAAFSHRPVASQLVSLLSPAMLLWRARKLAGEKTVVFYNRLPAYVPALLLASALRLRTVLDLEDGELPPGTLAPRQRLGAAMRRLFDRRCSGGALLACRALEGGTALRPVACYYGTVDCRPADGRWPDGTVSVLLGGTVSRDTGAHLVAAAIERLRRERPEWARGLRLDVTGQGDALLDLQRLAGDNAPALVVHGRTSAAAYRAIVEKAQVGLALKPRSGPLSRTTFPSKVIELAGAGLLVLTTDISDVREVLGEGALYLDDETPEGLVDRLRWIVQHPAQAQAIADAGRRRTLERCEPAKAGRALANFLFPRAA